MSAFVNAKIGNDTNFDASPNFHPLVLCALPKAERCRLPAAPQAEGACPALLRHCGVVQAGHTQAASRISCAGVSGMWAILFLFLQSAASRVLYLALQLETGSFPRPLSAAEERAAVAAMRAGDAAARETLICHNLRLVAHIVKKYYAAPGAQDDFISIGTIGLIKAVDTYDESRAARFASYASRCIENELRMQLRRTRREGSTVSLQEPLEEDGALSLADVLPDPADMAAGCEQRDAARQLHTALAAMPRREREVLRLRYGLGGVPPQTQQQVAARFGISRSYVSRLEKRALGCLQKCLKQTK